MKERVGLIERKEPQGERGRETPRLSAIHILPQDCLKLSHALKRQLYRYMLVHLHNTG